MSTPPTASLTSDNFRRALVAKGVLLKDYSNAALVAEAIKSHGLESVVCQGTRPPISYLKAYALVFGEVKKVGR